VTDSPKLRLELSRAEGQDPELGLLLAALTDTRRRMRLTLRGLPPDLVDCEPPGGGSSIGALLYHVAIIEADWLYDDILGTQDTDWPKELFPVDARADGEHLTAFAGESVEQHLERLGKVRELLVSHLEPMSPEELHRPRERSDYFVSPAWAVHHLMQHEAEHRSQIGSVREALGAGAGW
jgi:uncharacterized damage-inducible protein DinB